MEGIVDTPVNPATGNLINSDAKSGDLYVTYSISPDQKLWNPDYNPGNTFAYDEGTKWYKFVGDDIFDNSNWVESENPNKAD
jgi:hypothetical protein